MPYVVTLPSWALGHHRALATSRQLIAILEDEPIQPASCSHCPDAFGDGVDRDRGADHKARQSPSVRPIAAIDVSIRLATVPGIGPVIVASLSLGQRLRPRAVPRQTGVRSLIWALSPGSIRPVANQGWAPFPRWATGTCASCFVVGAHAALYRMKKGKADTPLANWARWLAVEEALQACCSRACQQDCPHCLGDRWQGDVNFQSERVSEMPRSGSA